MVALCPSSVLCVSSTPILPNHFNCIAIVVDRQYKALATFAHDTGRQFSALFVVPGARDTRTACYRLPANVRPVSGQSPGKSSGLFTCTVTKIGLSAITVTKYLRSAEFCCGCVFCTRTDTLIERPERETLSVFM